MSQKQLSERDLLKQACANLGLDPYNLKVDIVQTAIGLAKNTNDLEVAHKFLSLADKANDKIIDKLVATPVESRHEIMDLRELIQEFYNTPMIAVASFEEIEEEVGDLVVVNEGSGAIN